MSRRVVIVGAGAIGLLAAYHLRKGGCEVTLLDREKPGGACSSGNAGWVTPSISLPVPRPGLRRTGPLWLLRVDSPLYIKPAAIPFLAPWLWRFWRACSPAAFERGAGALQRFAAGAPALFRELREDGVPFEWSEDGLLMVFEKRENLAEELSLLRRFDYGPVRELGPDDLREMEPVLDSGQGGRPAGGLHVLPEGVVRPETLCAGVAERCAALGVQVREDFPVDGIRLEPGGRPARARSVHGPQGEIEADTFVIATGAEAGRLAARCGTPLPLQAGKGYSVTVRRPRLSIRHPLYLAEAKIGVSPFAGCHRVAGTMELSGINRRLDPRRLAAFRRAAERAIPGILDGAESEAWVGMRPMTPDGLPVLGRLPSTENVFISSGHQMLGITLAPASAHALAGLILPEAGRAAVDPAPFDPARFG